MGLLLNLGWVLVPPGQVPARHYFLEQLNKPEYIWGIRVVCLMSAVMFLFLYQRLKESMEAAEAVASGEVMAADDSAADIDNVPVIEIDFTSNPDPIPVAETVSAFESVPTPEPKPEPVHEDVPVMETTPEPEPIPASETVSVLETVTASESESVHEQERTPELEYVSDRETESKITPITEHISRARTEIKTAGRPVAVSELSEPDAASNIWLWALVGVSVSIGGIVLLSIYRRKRRVA